jgi:iron only hydrogenase large subunit-like protein/uncharacterized Fe-S cluster-containing protein
MQATQTQIVFTDKARCRDCYRCLRACPVKAIGVRDGQAFVVEARCISCGTCIRECPQQAKAYRNDLAEARRLVGEADPVAASVAPSFAALLSPWEWRRLPSALRRLGFTYVSETAVGAFHVAAETARYVERTPDRPHVCTACPAVVSYVEKYRPELIDTLVPVVSPMIAHARQIRAAHGPRTRVVFIGPCVAKKAEAQRPEYRRLVHCVLTFRELLDWFEAEDISLSECEESGFDEAPGGAARYFPLPGGLARTATLHTDLLDEDIVAPSGFEEVFEALESTQGERPPRLIEPLFCPQGCINGPGMTKPGGVYARRAQVLRFAGNGSDAARITAVPDAQRIDLAGAFHPDPHVAHHSFTEDQIRAELARTGKSRPEDQLNCGACGYASCRDKAIAALMGLAEPEMCIPRMRRLAEQRTDRIIETSPNGIITLNERLEIMHMNPAFRRMFCCSDAICGRRISYLMDPEPFERLTTGQESPVTLTVRHEKYNLLCHEIIYRLPEERQYVGIFVNITNSQASEEKLRQLQSQTARQARELLEHQVTMAQQIARLLGESTARGEELVRNLLQYANDPRNTNEKPAIWGMYTSTS